MELEKNNDQQIEACTLTAEEIIAEELAKEALEETVQNTDTTDGDLKNDLETVPHSKPMVAPATRTPDFTVKVTFSKAISFKLAPSAK